MESFGARSNEPELMEAADNTPEDMAACLADLARVNTLTAARPPTLRWLAHATRELPRGASFTLLDVGCGEGDMLRAIHRSATRRGLVPRLVGIDLDPSAVRAARVATDDALGIEFHAASVFQHAPATPPDYVTSSLVAHHMRDDEIVRFFAWMERTARRGWLVSDLHRHAVAYHGFRALASVARWHRFVRHDGPVSIARAFRREDWSRYLDAAGIPRDAVTVRWHVPFRWCVGRVR